MNNAELAASVTGAIVNEVKRLSQVVIDLTAENAELKRINEKLSTENHILQAMIERLKRERTQEL